MTKEEQKHLYPEGLASYLIDVLFSIVVNFRDHNFALVFERILQTMGRFVCIRNGEERLEELLSKDIIAFVFSQTKEWELEEMGAVIEFLLSAASSIQNPQLLTVSVTLP